MNRRAIIVAGGVFFLSGCGERATDMSNETDHRQTTDEDPNDRDTLAGYGFEDCEYPFNSEKIGPDLESTLRDTDEYDAPIGRGTVLFQYRDGAADAVTTFAQTNGFEIRDRSEHVNYVRFVPDVCTVAEASHKEYITRIEQPISSPD
ncbi:uncharacterized protein NP_6272A (plasmid) [Natronomonas pharaonis DSM 2160]|uniref:Uncharacterized protein n=1 Tax=Natronomonas pharaonis (strain ATCC 35678 / DSM 2160 / CIP 103997 / JCM 8858 / NBRC 14720 / NCIMB 2260 / Gabara) TaxID=348780 RepID=Q3ILV4_NATPD|nr:hypothetical protein [Natronomonas pharaonis]CAI50916.1 uncharacterized protein NP_6272A [Natronomonas pharaonis DSM 2160]